MLFLRENLQDESRFVIPGVLTQRKAQPHKSLNSDDIIRPGTRMTRIKRIYTDLCVPTLRDNIGRPAGSNVLAGGLRR
ncbi:MAG: hypothetical protein Q8M95_05125 [Candidatus Methanoperedens sp.]|nr:hypothetical protein [Candidatus Methanoperedens sp.]